MLNPKTVRRYSGRRYFKAGVTTQILKQVGRATQRKLQEIHRAAANDAQGEWGDDRGRAWGRTVLQIRLKESTVYLEMKKSH